jgi:aminoglycoside phosphotransferase (APT) family kinase protein
VDMDESLVWQLVATQFPQWAELPIRPVERDGWDNRTFHLGDHMAVRLPSAAAYIHQVEKEHKWLPKLAPLLPLQIPVPLAKGVPAHGYPWHWSIYRWLEGETATVENIRDLPEFATTLAEFLIALQQIDILDGPQPGSHNFFRGGSLTSYDGETRQAIRALGDTIDSRAATRVWESALATPWCGPPVWFHGDVSAGNLLIRNGALCAVIDFGCSGVGDPACDLSIAFTLFNAESRQALRRALPLDDATWARGRGWALWKALLSACRSSEHSANGKSARRVINEVLADHENSL